MCFGVLCKFKEGPGWREDRSPSTWTGISRCSRWSKPLRHDRTEQRLQLNNLKTVLRRNSSPDSSYREGDILLKNSFPAGLKDLCLPIVDPFLFNKWSILERDREREAGKRNEHPRRNIFHCWLNWKHICPHESLEGYVFNRTTEKKARK